ncbi:cytochrome c oxidase, cbb3-type, CcoQ subunit [Halarcobacter bivalviorum]|uniref:Cytochrome c oxidase CcoNOPQ, cbb3-type, subunit IV n=1 Tax=Halarcobacter bivalviorum TaxID=663364 RepID=A0AAX2A8K5_9BACT|nr:cytochrome c oxidase, cbb3-type, CcoQ subunit [Halarcobacter bivalviorum]AXH13218.1 cytochrome c oxidase CcoNOPQ, cbb3-type, subunit IV [Halarcobacter bivalviorum]RXK10175.1 cytochrome c oxidase, cbb3-type, CcoQ subunit [Halarcobacter bivalviorum]
MDQETLLTIQGYAKFFLILAVFIVFYSYAFSIYRRDKKGERDFEKYSNLVHDDAIESDPLEDRNKEEKNKEKEK